MGGHPVFAVPADSKSARLAGIARYQPISFKRSLYRKIMRAAIGTGLDRFLSSSVQNPIVNYPDFDFSTWLAFTQARLGVGELIAAVFWPPQVDRGRVYVHLLNTDNQPIGYAKISFDDHNDACLESESKALGSIEGSKPKSFRVPKILDFQPTTDNRHAVLIIESIPVDAVPLDASMSCYPAQCVGEIGAEHSPIGPGGHEAFSWWQNYLNLTESLDSSFVDELAQASSDNTTCCQTHGDFWITNMVKEPNGDLWIFDWEECCQDGPILADEISYFLGVHRPSSQPEFDSLVAEFQERFLDESPPQRRIDVMLALAYRSTVNARKADLIISRWNQF